MKGFNVKGLERQFRRRTFGRHISFHASCGSTNDLAFALAAERFPEGTIVLADHQTAGVGRKGNAWHSPPGAGIYLSAILYPPPSTLRGLPITLWASLAACEAVRDATGISLSIKWPNDLFFGTQHKVGGIMAAVRKLPEGTLPVTVLGLGLNVLEPRGGFPPEIAGRAASLEGLARTEVSRQRVLIAFLLRLDETYRLVREGQNERIHRQIEARANFLGRRVGVREGNRSYVGRAKALGADGVLVFEDDSGKELRLASAEVEILE